MRIVPTVASVVLLAADLYAAESIERYQSIIDRQMFGKPPPGFDPKKMPSEVSRTQQKALTKEQERLQSSVHFSVINIADDGTPVVGFTDNADPKKPVHLYLKVGEERSGWKVVQADPKSATMTIVKGEIELSMSLGDNSSKGAGGAGKTAKPAVASAAAPQTLHSRRRNRRKLAQEAEARMAAERAAKEQEEQARREQNEAEKEAQREQLMALHEELKRMREETKLSRQASEGEAAE